MTEPDHEGIASNCNGCDIPSLSPHPTQTNPNSCSAGPAPQPPVPVVEPDHEGVVCDGHNVLLVVDGLHQVLLEHIGLADHFEGEAVTWGGGWVAARNPGRGRLVGGSDCGWADSKWNMSALRITSSGHLRGGYGHVGVVNRLAGNHMAEADGAGDKFALRSPRAQRGPLEAALPLPFSVPL